MKLGCRGAAIGHRFGIWLSGTYRTQRCGQERGIIHAPGIRYPADGTSKKTTDRGNKIAKYIDLESAIDVPRLVDNYLG